MFGVHLVQPPDDWDVIMFGVVYTWCNHQVTVVSLSDVLDNFSFTCVNCWVLLYVHRWISELSLKLWDSSVQCSPYFSQYTWNFVETYINIATAFCTPPELGMNLVMDFLKLASLLIKDVFARCTKPCLSALTVLVCLCPTLCSTVSQYIDY